MLRKKYFYCMNLSVNTIQNICLCFTQSQLCIYPSIYKVFLGLFHNFILVLDIIALLHFLECIFSPKTSGRCFRNLNFKLYFPFKICLKCFLTIKYMNTEENYHKRTSLLSSSNIWFLFILLFFCFLKETGFLN